MAGTNSLNKIGFWETFVDSLKIFFNRLGLFAPILVIFLVASFGINYLGQRLVFMSFEAGMVKIWLMNGIYILISLISFVLAAYQALAMIKASNETLKGKKIDFTEAFSYGLKNLWRGMITMFRQFWYVFWVAVLPVIILLVVFVVMGALNGINGVVYDADTTVVAQGLLNADVDPGEIEDISLGSGVINLGEGHGVSFKDPYLAASMITQYLMGGLGIVLVIWMLFFLILRGIRSMFAMYVLVDQGKSWTAALKGSIELTKGNFWKIFWFMFLYWIILMGFMVLMMILGMGGPRSMVLVLIHNFIVMFLSTGFVVVFMNKIYLALKA